MNERCIDFSFIYKNYPRQVRLDLGSTKPASATASCSAWRKRRRPRPKICQPVSPFCLKGPAHSQGYSPQRPPLPPPKCSSVSASWAWLRRGIVVVPALISSLAWRCSRARGGPFSVAADNGGPGDGLWRPRGGYTASVWRCARGLGFLRCGGAVGAGPQTG